MISDDVCSPLSLGEGWGEAPIKVSAPPMSSSARKKVYMAYIQLTTPSEPASAVSTAMRILRSLPQLKEVVCDMLDSGLPLPLQREG